MSFGSSVKETKVWLRRVKEKPGKGLSGSWGFLVTRDGEPREGKLYRLSRTKVYTEIREI